MKNTRYIRQTVLKEVGVIGQLKLSNAKVMIVGCGGLGNFVAVSLASSGVGTIHLIDFDTIDLSNLHRQVFYKTEDIGKSKAEILSRYINSINDEVNISFSNKKLSKAEVRNEIKKYDYIIDCTDSLHTKYMLNDACVLEKKPFIYGSLHKFEAHVSNFNISNNKERTANLRDVFPEIPTENIPTCSEVGTLNPIVGITGLLQANEVLKLILGIGKPLINQLLIINSLDNSQMKIKLKINKNLDFKEIWNSNSYEEEICSLLDPNEIDIKEFQEKTKENSIKIINVAEEKTDKLKVDLHFPFSSLDIDNIELEKGNYVVICKKGKTSLASLFLLQTKYPEFNFKSLAGGFSSLD